MLTFAGLVVAHWFGFTAPNIPESVQNSLLNIVLVGMGGYIVGRSGEKIMDKYKEKKIMAYGKKMKNKKLAKAYGDPKKITRGDVIAMAKKNKLKIKRKYEEAN